MTGFDAEAVRAFEHAGWERAAGRYEATFALATRPFIPHLLKHAHVAAGQAVLDVACGPGVVAASAADLGAKARGLDFSAAMIAEARRRRPGLTFDHGDAEALPYADDSFDAVVSNFGIHHVPDPSRALREAWRVLKPGGRIAFSVWAEPSVNIGWKLVFDAVAKCGDPGASAAPKPGGGLHSGADCVAALREAEFARPETWQIGAIWLHDNGASLLQALRSGTARMAALIDAQRAEALVAMAAEIDRAASAHRRPDGLAVPIAAVIAAAVKD